MMSSIQDTTITPGLKPLCLAGFAISSLLSMPTLVNAQTSVSAQSAGLAIDQRTKPKTRQVNPSVGGLLTGTNAVTNLLKTVIARPPSVFVTQIGYDAECARGLWGRDTFGKAKVTSDVDNSLSVLPSTANATYYGLQLGLDTGCFDGRYKGWDMTFGGTLGYFEGTLEQNIYAVLGGKTITLSNTVNGTLQNAFSHKMGSAYLVAQKDDVTVEVSVRKDKSDFALSETTIGTSPALGFDGATYTSQSTGLSAALSRFYGNETTNVFYVPVIGFDTSRTSSSDIQYLNGDSLVQPDFTNTTAFAGLTVGKSHVLESGLAALTYYGTATYYKDLSGDRVSVFNDVSGATSTQLRSSNINGFGELSLGLSYVQVLDNRFKGPFKQMNLNARVDAKYGSGVNSLGLALNARYAF